MRDMKKRSIYERENYAKTLLFIQRKRSLPTDTISGSKLRAAVKRRSNRVARGVRTLDPIVLGEANAIE